MKAQKTNRKILNGLTLNAVQLNVARLYVGKKPRGYGVDNFLWDDGTVLLWDNGGVVLTDKNR